MNSIKKICQNSFIRVLFDVVWMYLLMVLIFLYILNHDMSSAPEFIYNQF